MTHLFRSSLSNFKFRYLVCLVLMFSLFPSGSYVAAYDKRFFSSNEILIYNPDDEPCSFTGGAITTLSGTNSRQKVWNYLIAKGLSPEQTAGVMGYIRYKSDFTPTRYSDDGAWGLLQWSGPRLFEEPSRGILGEIPSNLEKYVDESFDTTRHPDAIIPPEDLDALMLFQLNYMYDESSVREVTTSDFGSGTNEWDLLKHQLSVDLAASFWAENFGELDSATDSSEIITIIDYANGLFGELDGTVADDGGESVCGGYGSLETKVLEYAWPEYHSAPYTTKKPEYATAIDKAKSSGGYVGGSIYPGVDCGGFVTRLVVDSGFDPTYNHNGKISDGASTTPTQQAWLISNWESLGNAASINVADLEPGDVAIKSGHTFIYVGVIEGFDSDRASASIGGDSGSSWRAPMAGKESLVDAEYTWYRKNV